MCPVTLDADNLGSISGQRFEDFSALVNTALLYDVWPDYSNELSTTARAEQFNAWLTELQQAAINQVMHSIFEQNNDMLYNEVLYKHEMDFNTVISNDTDFVGFKVDITKDRRYVSIINSVKATFDADGDVKLLLFNTAKKMPVESKSIAVVAGDTVEVELGWALDPRYSGNYYIGYLTGGLLPKAYDRNFELANLPTSLPYSCFQEIKIPGHDSEVLFNTKLEQNVSKSWGLNFDISAFIDWTQIATSNKREFLSCIGMQVAVNCLDKYINSPRSNRNERISRADARLALEGNTNPELGLFTQGLRTRLQEEVESKRNLFIRKSMISRGTLH